MGCLEVPDEVGPKVDDYKEEFGQLQLIKEDDNIRHNSCQLCASLVIMFTLVTLIGL